MKQVRRRSLRLQSGSMSAEDRQVLVWTLRASLVTGAHRFIDWEARMFAQTGLEVLEDDRDLTRDQRERLIRRALREVERESASSRKAAELLTNVELLGEPLGLDIEERMVLALAAAAAVNQQLSRCFDDNDGRSPAARAQVIAAVLDLDHRKVLRAVRPDGTLARLGLLRTGGNGSNEWFSLRSNLESVLLQSHRDADALLQHFARLAPLAEVGLADFEHLERDLRLVLPALRGAVDTRTRGFHLLLYGEPGTGKTQLARALASALGCPLFEVGVEDDDHEAHSRRDRLGNYWVCQHYGARLPRALVAFDEMEDVFNQGVVLEPFGRSSRMQKGFTNRMLEETPIPTIWCSNEVDGVDPAFLRRFDLALEVPAPPRTTRRRMLEKHLQALSVGDEVVDRIARCEAVTPADCERAARAVRLAGLTEAVEAEAALERVLELRLKVRGKRSPTKPGLSPGVYSLRYVNADLDVDGFVAGLKASGQGTVLFHGPPGTGKSALARHLADTLERPLLVRYGSDLLDMYVGQTEKAIAAMFSEARAQDAVLFLDEADSFLGSREGSRHRWEVSQTNELLVRMEGFDGLFLCATNRLEALDPACLRRFAIKVGFRALDGAQALELFAATLEAAGQPAMTADRAATIGKALAGMSQLAPGDFAAVWRKARMLGLALTAGELLKGLEGEARAKGASRTAIGF